MHILEIPSFFPPYGGLFCLDQAKALAQLGHEVRILSCNQLGFTVTPIYYIKARKGRWWETMDGIEVYRSNMHGLPKLVRYNQRRWCDIVRSMYSDYVSLYGKPDIIHAHCCQWAGTAASMIASNEHIPYVITEHLSAVLFEKSYGVGWTRHTWAKQILTNAYENASTIIPVSEELVDNLAPYFGKNYKYTAISNIIDTSFYTFKQRTPRNNRPFRLCCLAVANIYEKGYDVLSKALEGIEKTEENNGTERIELHLAGRGTDGKEINSLFGHYSNVIIHGELDKHGVRNLLYHCDALVLPSRGESQGLVILEALSTGIPVVTTDAIPRNAIVPEGCLIARTGDADSLRQQIRQCLNVQPSESFSEAVRQIASPQIVAKNIDREFRHIDDIQ